jgi:diacylglycerol kinase family enzyme
MPNAGAFLLVNPRSGTGEASPELVRAAAERGIETHVLAPGEDATELARAAAADVLAVAGGDGTLGVVAQVALERSLPFACVPFGTRNHFARDLDHDLDDPVAALDVLLGGSERSIDVGRAGSRVFLNNVSIGAYARLVHGPAHDWRARTTSVLRALRTSQRLRIDGAPVDARVALFANNAYSFDMLSIGGRERLDEGRLHLYVAHGLLRTAWEERVGERFVVEGTGAQLEVAIDGEALRVDAPLEISIAPRALRVRVPRVPD